jgi:hypothetical protein
MRQCVTRERRPRPRVFLFYPYSTLEQPGWGCAFEGRFFRCSRKRVLTLINHYQWKNEVHVTRRGDGTRQTLNPASTSTTKYQ